MPLIQSTDELSAFCRRLAQAPAIMVDTEFMRDRSYWPKLCLVQLAGPEEARAVDPLAEGIDLKPLYELMLDESVLKVFHAARQDVEIFHQQIGRVPHPIFDTQVAAMVSGFGDSVGYDKLAARFANARVDKASQFTDWARRPLSERQLGYALADVVHLRAIYRGLADHLAKSGRTRWLDEEMAILTDPATYDLDPENSWRRLKFRSRSPRYLGVLKEVAAWREREAQRRDQPRSHVLRDDAIQELAAEQPTDVEALKRLRSVPKGLAEGRIGDALLTAVKRGLALTPAELPKLGPVEDLPRGIGPLVDLLKVLLKQRCEENDVAQKLVASVSDLEKIAASDEADVPALRGWRREMFGEEALELKRGRLAIAAARNGVKLIRLDAPERAGKRAE
jgi:ribonuclease D